MRHRSGFHRSSLAVATLVSSLALFVPSSWSATAPDIAPGETVELSEATWGFLEELSAPVDKWKRDIEDEKNDDGVHYKSVAYSRTPRKVDDSTYVYTAHVNTANRDHQLTERMEVTVSKEGSSWKIADKQTVDSYVALYRSTGMACAPFDKFSFDREGMTVSASNGSVCEAFFQGKVSRFYVHADDLKYAYTPPEHAGLVPTGHDFYALQAMAEKAHAEQLDFEPAAAYFSCDLATCEEFLTECFTGLERTAPEEREKFDYDRSAIDEWIRPLVADVLEARKDDAFSGFRLLDLPGNRQYSVFLSHNLDERDSGVRLSYDNWGDSNGWEVLFWVFPKRWDLPDQLAGPIYGYFSEETLKNTDPTELEARTGGLSRWLEVEALKGRVDLATLDAEKLQGDVEFRLVVRQDTDKLPFGIVSFAGGAGDRPKPITVNSIRVNGEEVTWVKTGATGGIFGLPEMVKAGTKVDVRMQWESRAILKYTSSYSYMSRQGWMPFVRFGDFIDEFELTFRSPAEYDILAAGHKIDERIDGDTRVSTWAADMPINFPTVIFGRYQSDTPGKNIVAKKLDGTEIPIAIHVDRDSFSQVGIAPKALRPLASQAANAINLYSAVTGLDYPFGELNLVNDPTGFLYGQAPSSIIYLGSGVFLGEGKLATATYPWGDPYFVESTSISVFLKSVVAHEVGHQWWGNRIAHANYRNYWFVESLAEYFSAIFMEYVHGWDSYMGQVEEWRRTIMNSNLKGSVQNATTLFAGERGGGRTTNATTAAIYNKGPYAFHMLREIFKGEGPRGDTGADARFFAFLRDATQELAEKREIVTFDIQHAAEKAFGGVDENGNPYNVDLSWFFDQWIRGSGVPQYRLNWSTRLAEDGSHIVEGTIEQRVLLGSSDEVMDGRFYRGIVDLKVDAKGGPYVKRYIINDPVTQVLLKVPAKPVDVTLDEEGEMLAHDTVYNASW